MQLFNNSAIKIELFPKKNKKNKKRNQDSSKTHEPTATCTSRPPTRTKIAQQYTSGIDQISAAQNQAAPNRVDTPINNRTKYETAETGSLQQGQQHMTAPRASFDQARPSFDQGASHLRPDSGPDPHANRWVELPPNSPLVKAPPQSPLISSRKAWGVEQLAPNSMSRLGTHAQRSPNTKTKISENMAKALASKKSRERLQQEPAMSKKQSQRDLRTEHVHSSNVDLSTSNGPPGSSGSSDSDGAKRLPARPVQGHKSNNGAHGPDRRSAKVPGTVNNTTAGSSIAQRRSVADLNNTEKSTKANRPVYADSEAQTSPDPLPSKRRSRQMDPSRRPAFDNDDKQNNDTSNHPRLAPQNDFGTDIRSKRRSRSENSLRPQPRSDSQPRSRSHNRPKPAQINVQDAQSSYRNQTGVSPMDWASKAAADRKRQWNYNYDAASSNGNKSSSNYTNGSMPSVDAHVQENSHARRRSWVQQADEFDGDYGSATTYGSHRISYGSPNPATIFGRAFEAAGEGLGQRTYSARTAGRV